MRPEQEFALQWLHKARNVLLSAKAVLASEYGITDVPCFHAQQTVEKAFKGFLTWHSISFGKTHDLMILLKINTYFKDPAPGRWNLDASTLSQLNFRIQRATY